MKAERSKKIAIVVALVLVQSLLFLLACVSDCLSEHSRIRACLSGEPSGIIMLAGMCMSVIGIVFILRIYRSMEKEVLSEVESAELQKSRELIKSLRAQRHEFGNHLQVICGLIQLNNNRKALHYINNIVQDVKSSGNMMVVDESPVIYALLLTKFTQAQTSGIKFSVDLQADLSKLALPQYKVGKILANIINNALDAVSELQEDERRVEVKVLQTPMHIVFKVWNNGSVIEPSAMQKIFEPGYTTKGEKGQGLGLYIVKAMLQEMNGDVQVDSSVQGGTTFTVSLPLRKEPAQVVVEETSIPNQMILEDASI